MNMTQTRTVDAPATIPELRAALANDVTGRGDQFLVRDVFGAFWSSKWTILALMLTCAAIAVVVAYVTPKQYEATAVLLPVSDSSSGALAGAGGALSQFGGGLAMLAGLGGPTDARKARALEMLQSDDLTRQYIKDNGLLPILYSNLWDASKKTWTVSDPTAQPTLWKANERFKSKIRVVKPDPKSGLVTLTITWTDPQIAAKWANDLVKITNDYLRSRAIAQTERNIVYLNKAAESTTAVEAKQAIYSLLKNEVNEAMLARGTSEYAFEVLDPAAVPEAPTSPKKPLYLIIGLAIGFLFSVVLVSFRASWI